MKRESRLLYVFRGSVEGLYLFCVFRGVLGPEHIKIVRGRSLVEALETFSRERIFGEVRAVVVDRELYSLEEVSGLREYLGERDLVLLSIEEVGPEMRSLVESYREVFKKILCFLSRETRSRDV